MEGSVYQSRMVYHNIAFRDNSPGIIVADMLRWNVRAVLIRANDRQLKEELNANGFTQVYSNEKDILMFNRSAPTYFMRGDKDAIVMGKASLGLCEAFPWLAWGRSPTLKDYSMDFLSNFRLIYLIEPVVKDFRRFQEAVAALAGAGKTIIVEFGRAETWPLLGVNPYWEKIMPGSTLVSAGDGPYKLKIPLDADPYGQAPATGNLDGVWLEMEAGAGDWL